ncbi:MAG: 5'-nucleotidase C-terminal domain-containing protein [Clostridia bacterium]|jgi:5'-nucleotidase|nr:5'-nucleotidase C-terminal domain-containing protein [Clostridia bacterium]
MKFLRKLTVVLIMAALMLMLFPGLGVYAASDETVYIFHTNDIHGRAGAASADEDGGVIGYARYKTVLDEARTDVGAANVIALDAGDVTHGTNFATLSKGESMIKLMNKVGIDAMTSGNHEFNYGPDRLLELEAMANFPIMAANITKKAGGASLFAQNEKVFTTAEGRKIAVFGLDTPETMVKADPKYTRPFDFGAGEDGKSLNALAAIAQAKINALKAAGADYVILLAHLGVDTESVIRSDLLIPKLSGLTLAIDGHSHTEMSKKIKDKDNNEVYLVQTGSHFANIGKVTLVLTDSGVTPTVKLLSYDDVKGYAKDAAVQADIDAFHAANEVVLGEVIGKTKVELDGERDHVRAGETNLTRLISDALLKETGADVVLSNGGNVRRSIPAGDITMGVALEVLPFENTIITLKVTGQDIVDALTHGAGAYPGTAGGFPNVAGMKFTIVTTKNSEGETVFKEVRDVLIGGKPVDLKATYTLATNDFLAGGGDGFVMFEGRDPVGYYGLMLDIFANEIRELSKGGAFDYVAEQRLKIVADTDLEDMEDITPTGETTLYLLAGSLMLLMSAALLLSRRKIESK